MQAARVYAKSGAHGRAQFISLFMEELLAGALEERPGPTTGAAPVAPPSGAETLAR